MADSLREKLLEESADHVEKSNEESGSFELLRTSLTNITEAWENKAVKDIMMITGDDSRAQWRKDLAEMLESTTCHVLTISLLLLDLFATVVDILKTIHNKTHDLNSCSTLLEGCQCVDHFEETKSLEFIFWISIVILSILALNVILLLIAFGIYFFHHPGYVLDALVVGTALGLEIFLDSDTIGLLIILTLWRIVRVAHGIFEVTDGAWEQEIKEFGQRLKEAESKHVQLLQEKEKQEGLLQEKDKRIAELEGAVRAKKHH